MRFRFAVALATAALVSGQPAIAGHHETGISLEQAIAHDRRDDDRARDAFRHPKETLEFFQVKPGMTVVDYMPGGGWYTRILLPYLGEGGTYIGLATNFAQSSARSQHRQRVFPERFPRLVRENMGEAGAQLLAFNTAYIPEEHMGTVDRVLIFRMLHNLHRWGLLQEQLKTLRGLLKEDGKLAIIQHRAKETAPYAYADGENAYMRQSDVVRLIEANGFELVDTSEINANPKDTADHEGGVWDLPPVSASEDPAKQAIGESDRMTLLFRKRP